jgi:hypothetical protein
MFDMSEGRETLPVDHVLLLVGTPVLCQKPIFTTNDFRIEIRGELWPVICQTSYAEITAKKRGRKVYVLNIVLSALKILEGSNGDKPLW